MAPTLQPNAALRRYFPRNARSLAQPRLPGARLATLACAGGPGTYAHKLRENCRLTKPSCSELLGVLKSTRARPSMGATALHSSDAAGPTRGEVAGALSPAMPPRTPVRTISRLAVRLAHQGEHGEHEKFSSIDELCIKVHPGLASSTPREFLAPNMPSVPA